MALKIIVIITLICTIFCVEKSTPVGHYGTGKHLKNKESSKQSEPSRWHHKGYHVKLKRVHLHHDGHLHQTDKSTSKIWMRHDYLRAQVTPKPRWQRGCHHAKSLPGHHPHPRSHQADKRFRHHNARAQVSPKVGHHHGRPQGTQKHHHHVPSESPRVHHRHPVKPTKSQKHRHHNFSTGRIEMETEQNHTQNVDIEDTSPHDEAKQNEQPVEILGRATSSKRAPDKCFFKSNLGIRGECRKYLHCPRIGADKKVQECTGTQSFDHVKRECVVGGACDEKTVCPNNNQKYPGLPAEGKEAYLQCQNGVPQPKKCQPGFTYSAISSSCVKPDG